MRRLSGFALRLYGNCFEIRRRELLVTWPSSDIELSNVVLLHSELCESHWHGMGRKRIRENQAINRLERWQDPT